MTGLLKQLLNDCGLLYITIGVMDEARQKWSDAFGPPMSEEELWKIPVAHDEPLLLVRIAKEKGASFLSAEEHSLQFTDQQTSEAVGELAVLELPEDLFYFCQPFINGLRQLQTDLPNYFYGMCLVHAYGRFECYLSDLLRTVLIKRPEMLGKTKTLSYGDVFESYPSMDTLIHRMAERETKEFFYKSCRDILETLRSKYGFSTLSSSLDPKLIELSLIRNCCVHNRGLADSKLEEANNIYKQGEQIIINKELVFDAISVFRTVAKNIDMLAEKQHFKSGIEDGIGPSK